MKMLNLKLTGITPLLMHSARGVDQIDPDVQAHAELTKRAKKEKTPALFIEVAKSEFMLGMYWDAKLGPYIPTDNVMACIVKGAAKHRNGQKVASGVVVVSDQMTTEGESAIKLSYKGTNSIDPEVLWNKKFYHKASVVVQRNRVMRYRPMFKEWSLDVSIAYDDDIIDYKDLSLAVEMAGKYVGLGDFRVACKGSKGQFGVEEYVD